MFFLSHRNVSEFNAKTWIAYPQPNIWLLEFMYSKKIDFYLNKTNFHLFLKSVTVDDWLDK